MSKNQKAAPKAENPGDPNPLHAEVRKLRKDLNAVTKYLEAMFNFDINKDGKVGASMLAVCVSFVVAFLLFTAVGFAFTASTDPATTVWQVTDKTQTNALGRIDSSGNLRVEGGVTSATFSVTTLAGTSASITSANITTLTNTTLVTTGEAAIQRIGTILMRTTATNINSSNYGKILMIDTNAAVAVTLSTNTTAAGTWFDVGVYSTASDSCAPTIASDPADTLITPNSLDSDSVTWGTGHRIGAYARFWCDGAKWHVLNLGGTTMTYTDSD